MYNEYTFLKKACERFIGVSPPNEKQINMAKGMQCMQERCLEHALQPLKLASTVTDNLRKEA